MGKLSYLHEQIIILAGAMAANDAVSTNSRIDTARKQGFRLVKSMVAVTFEGKTTDQGPLSYGFAMNLSTQEIEDAVEADP